MARAKRKPIHKARQVSPDGKISALCYSNPRPIDMKCEAWTLTDAAVTCQRCLAAIESDRIAGAVNVPVDSARR